MTDTKDSAQRLDELEIHVAHQDRTIEDLHKVIEAQWREIEALKRQQLKQEQRLLTMEQDPGPEGSEPPPPHY